MKPENYFNKIEEGASMKTMRAIQIDRPTKAEEIVFSEVPVPEARPGWVLVKIKAFGLNHSEKILREGEIFRDYIKKPIIPGIECVGIVEDASDTGWQEGQKVISLMGGMGRSFDGSYAEYALLPKHHVFPVETTLCWVDMGAIPETYYTAWGSLMQRLRLQAEDKVLIRGGSCALGYAAIQIAKALGCRVAATSHRDRYLSLIEDAGADECIFDDGEIAGRVSGVTKALELIGCKTLFDTMQSVETGAIVCHTGVLGHVFTFQKFSPLNHIPNGVYLTGFHSNNPTEQDVQDIFGFMDTHDLKPLVGAVYSFDDMRQALIDFDGHKVQGKIVITVE